MKKFYWCLGEGEDHEEEKEANVHPAPGWCGADAGSSDAVGVVGRPVLVRGDHHQKPVGSIWVGRDSVACRDEPVPVGEEVMKWESLL